MSSDKLVEQFLARGVRAGTVLQDCVEKVRRARTRGEVEFEIALGELFVLASDAFKERNKYKHTCVEIKKQLLELQKEVEALEKALNK